MIDKESGIASIEVAVGHTSHSQEILAYKQVKTNHHIIMSPALRDGVSYYGHIKVSWGFFEKVVSILNCLNMGMQNWP